MQEADSGPAPRAHTAIGNDSVRDHTLVTATKHYDHCGHIGARCIPCHARIRYIDGSDCGIYVILNIRPDHVLRALDYTRTLMQQRTGRFAVREHSHASHDRLHRVRVDDALLHARNKKSRLTTTEVVIEIDKERKQTRLTGIRW